MTKRAGMFSSISLMVTILLFALSMLIGEPKLSYLSCMFLSWFYVLMISCLGTEILPERKGLAYGALAFACMYAVFVDLVYFTQLTTVAFRTAPEVVLEVLSYENPGSLMFQLDLYGYGMMSISTLLIGLAIKPARRADQWLKGLLSLHGVFSVTCILLPMFNVFQSANGSTGVGGIEAGTIALLFWCVYFLPIAILTFLHFRNSVTLYR